jgi:Orotate phosphoribosyltransferase homologs
MGRKRNPIYDQAYEMYLDGLSLEQVADELNVSRQCVYKAFVKRGFKLRGPNFRPHQFFDGKKFTLRNNGYYGLTTDDRILMHRYVYEFYNGKIPNGYDIHHKNELKYDNRIENLECLPKSEHTRLYSPHNNQYTKGRKRESNIPI